MKETNLTRLFKYKETRQMLLDDIIDVTVAVGCGLAYGIGYLLFPKFTETKLNLLETVDENLNKYKPSEKPQP